MRISPTHYSRPHQGAVLCQCRYSERTTNLITDCADLQVNLSRSTRLQSPRWHTLAPIIQDLGIVYVQVELDVSSKKKIRNGCQALEVEPAIGLYQYRLEKACVRLFRDRVNPRACGFAALACNPLSSCCFPEDNPNWIRCIPWRYDKRLTDEIHAAADDAARVNISRCRDCHRVGSRANGHILATIGPSSLHSSRHGRLWTGFNIAVGLKLDKLQVPESTRSVRI